VYYPKRLYKQYDEAFENSLVNTHYYSNYTKKEVRKERTFYYDGMETQLGINHYIDDFSPQVGIQFVMEIELIYDLENN